MSMRPHFARILTPICVRALVLVLVLSQTWTGALRGLELCIPIGQCEGCSDVGCSDVGCSDVGCSDVGCSDVAMHDEYARHGDHARHAHVHTHAYAHAHPHTHSHSHAHHAHHGEEGCICHIHVDTPDDDTHRGAAPSAGLMVVADLVGVVEAWMLATGALDASVRSEPPPGREDPAPSERAVIETTVLLV